MKPSRSDPFNPYTSHPRYVKTDGSQYRPGTISRYATFARHARQLLQLDRNQSKFNAHRTAATRRSRIIKAALALFFLLFLMLYGRFLVGWFLGHHLVIEHKHEHRASTGTTMRSYRPAIAKHSILMAFQSSPSADSFARRSLIRTAFRNYTRKAVGTDSKLHLVFYWDQHGGSKENEKRLYSEDVMHAANTFDFLSQIHSLEEYDHVVKMNQNVLVNFGALDCSDLDLNSTGLFVSHDVVGPGSVFDASAYILSTNLVFYLTHSVIPSAASPAAMKQTFEKDLGLRIKELQALGKASTPTADKSAATPVTASPTSSGAIMNVKSVAMTPTHKGALFIGGVDDLDAYMKGIVSFMV
ncbi:hypothetical protein BDR26DRAFT_871080 [Obelidium mucronatum]|nr:hypothetical protein BDR26DRAFT_871080 [Obelidium mucronatum]